VTDPFGDDEALLLAFAPAEAVEALGEGTALSFTLLNVTKSRHPRTLVNLIVERRLFKITTALFRVPVFLFLVFVDEIFYLAHTLIHCTVSLESRIQIIHNFGPHSAVIFTFQLVVAVALRSRIEIRNSLRCNIVDVRERTNFHFLLVDPSRNGGKWRFWQ